MTIDNEQLSQLRLMRGCVGSALVIAEAMGDTLLGALFNDVEQTINGRIAALVSAPSIGACQEAGVALAV